MMEGGHIYYHNTQCYSQETDIYLYGKKKDNMQYSVTLFYKEICLKIY